jgi:hypothetical protein
MINNQKTLEELNELVEVCLTLYSRANNGADICAAFNNNVSKEDVSSMRALFSDVQIMQSGAQDSGPFVLTGKKAETEDELKVLALKQIELAERFTEMVSRTISVDTLSALIENKSTKLSKDLIAVNAPTIAKLCV